MNFAQRLHDLRVSNNLTQTELSEHINGISRSALAMYEQDRRKPDFETLDELADFFNVSFDYLYGKTDVNTGYPSKRIHDPIYGLRKNDMPKAPALNDFEMQQLARLIAYHEKLRDLKHIYRLLEAYDNASPKTKHLVDELLDLTEVPTDGDC